MGMCLLSFLRSEMRAVTREGLREKYSVSYIWQRRTWGSQVVDAGNGASSEVAEVGMKLEPFNKCLREELNFILFNLFFAFWPLKE